MRKNFATSMLLSLAAVQLEPSTVNAMQIRQPLPSPVHDPKSTLFNKQDDLPLKITRRNRR